MLFTMLMYTVEGPEVSTVRATMSNDMRPRKYK